MIDDEKLECPICLDTICQEDIIKLNNCKHIFHKNCIWEWQKNNNSCPLCRKNICNFYFVKHNPFPFVYKKIIVETKEDKIYVYQYNETFENKYLNHQEFNINNLNLIMYYDYFKIKKMKVYKNTIKLYLVELNNNKLKSYKKTLFLNDIKESINIFNNVKNQIVDFYKKNYNQTFNFVEQ